MAEHGHTNRLHHDSGSTGAERPVTALDATTAGRKPSDLIFAFSGGEKLDLHGLSLLLTARQMAEADDRSVWVSGLSQRSWMLLKALGLEGMFKAFPPSGELS
jgi:hypothetical protein